MLSKIELRKKAKGIRNSLNIEAISEKIILNIRKLDIYKESKNVMIFYPLKKEVNLLPLLEDSKNFYLPRLKDENLEVCLYKKGDKLKTSEFNTQEPLTQSITADFLDLIFIPALMVSKDFYRLGYGKGYYDKFLADNAKQAFRIVPIPSSLLVDSLPFDEFDVQVDAIIDEI